MDVGPNKKNVRGKWTPTWNSYMGALEEEENMKE